MFEAIILSVLVFLRLEEEYWDFTGFLAEANFFMICTFDFCFRILT